MKEIISLHIGRGGIQVGNDAWEIFCLEHDISPTGALNPTHLPRKSNAFHSFFAQTKEGTVTPRCLFLDLQPSVFTEVQTGVNKKLYSQNQFVFGKEETNQNFARGYNLGKQIIDMSVERIRLLVENCSDFQGFLIYHTVGGGTGSGFTALLMQKLSQLYQKKSKVNFAIYPKISNTMPSKSIYNTILSTHSQLEYSNISIVFDNSKVQQIFKKVYYQEKNQYKSCIIPHIISTFTAPFRFDSHENSKNTNLAQLQTNLIPYPRIKFIIPSYFPIINFGTTCSDWSTTDMFQNCLQSWCQLVRCDPRIGKYMTCSVFYRGWISPGNINSACKYLKGKKTIQFVDWCPNAYAVNLIQRCPSVRYDGEIRHQNRACGMLSNSTCISQFFQRYCYNFDQMFSERLFLNQYVKEGVEEGKLKEARENLAELQQQYEIVQQPGQDEEEEVKVESQEK